jgi:hypothetical protein
MVMVQLLKDGEKPPGNIPVLPRRSGRIMLAALEETSGKSHENGRTGYNNTASRTKGFFNGRQQQRKKKGGQQ